MCLIKIFISNIYIIQILRLRVYHAIFIYAVVVYAPNIIDVFSRYLKFTLFFKVNNLIYLFIDNNLFQVGCLVGAAIADAASRPLHWVYDLSQLDQVIYFDLLLIAHD